MVVPVPNRSRNYFTLCAAAEAMSPVVGLAQGDLCGGYLDICLLQPGNNGHLPHTHFQVQLLVGAGLAAAIHVTLVDADIFSCLFFLMEDRKVSPRACSL